MKKAWTRHGHTGRDGAIQHTPEYRAWAAMKHRCSNPNNPRWDQYGGRGISVCEAWSDFRVFFRDVGARPGERYVLDRIDNEGSYEPGNVRWATLEESNRNRRSCRHLTFGGRTFTMAEWAVRLGFSKNTIAERLGRGWTVERALTQPLQKKTKAGGKS